jgi:hypothetical protein
MHLSEMHLKEMTAEAELELSSKWCACLSLGACMHLKETKGTHNESAVLK